MNVVRFRAEHLAALTLQPAQVYFSEEFTRPGYGAMLESSGAFTAIDGDGRVIAMAGVMERWRGHGTAWALLSCDAGQHMRFLCRAFKGFLEQSPLQRIEASVDAGFDAGERMLALLGFEREGLARAYRPDGGDCTIWARITR